MRKIVRKIVGTIALTVLLASVAGLVGPVRHAFADFDWSPLIVQWEARTPKIGTPGYPPGATPVQASSTDEADASAVATLPAAAGLTTWITHFRCTGTGATAAAAADITVGGPTNSEIYVFLFASGATAADTPVDVTYSPPIPASAPDTAITVTLGAGGSGAAHAACAAEGFQTASSP
jgi:hypothetical protein